MENSNKLINKVSGIAYWNESKYGGSAQAVVGAFKELTGSKIHDDVFKAATGLIGGIGLSGNTCGALTGSVMVLSIYLGREYDNFPDPEMIRHKSCKLARKLIEQFIEEYGSVICYDIQRKIMGRSYNLCDEKERADFFKAGGHDTKCTSVCGNAARWTMEILLEEGLF